MWGEERLLILRYLWKGIFGGVTRKKTDVTIIFIK